MTTVLVLSQTGSLMPECVRLTSQLLERDVEVMESPDQPYLALGHLLKECPADLYLLGYPHTDHAHLFGNSLSDTCRVTQGANLLARQSPELIEAHDTRPMGLATALRHLKVSAERALIIGKESPAFAAALGCSSNNIVDIDILNPGGFGNVSRRWRGVCSPEGVYDLVINTMHPEESLPMDALLEGKPTVVDLVQYHGSESVLLKQAAQRCCRTVGPVLPAALRTAFALCRLFHKMPNEERYVAHVREHYGI